MGHVVKVVMRSLGDGEGDLERDRVAIRWEGEPGDSRELTQADLLAEVRKAANTLTDRGRVATSHECQQSC